MKLKLIFVSAIILLLTFILVVTLRPQNSLAHLHDNLESRNQILISESYIDYDTIQIPFEFSDQWLSLEEILNQSNFSVRSHRGKKLSKLTFYVIDSPYHRSLVNPSVDVHMNVYTKNDKVVAAYLYLAEEPETALPLNYQEK